MIKVYSRNNCTQCKMTKRLLIQQNMAFEEINLDENPEARAYVKELGYSSAPVVVSGDVHFSGFRPDALKKLK